MNWTHSGTNGPPVEHTARQHRPGSRIRQATRDGGGPGCLGEAARHRRWGCADFLDCDAGDVGHRRTACAHGRPQTPRSAYPKRRAERRGKGVRRRAGSGNLRGRILGDDGAKRWQSGENAVWTTCVGACAGCVKVVVRSPRYVCIHGRLYLHLRIRRVSCSSQAT